MRQKRSGMIMHLVLVLVLASTKLCSSEINRLYRASLFPHKWEFVKDLISSFNVDEKGEIVDDASHGGGAPSESTPVGAGFEFIDSSPVLFNGRWYMFTFVKPASLHLYYSGKSPWTCTLFLMLYTDLCLPW